VENIASRQPVITFVHLITLRMLDNYSQVLDVQYDASLT